MKTILRHLRLQSALLLTALLPLASGCDWDESDDHEDYVPPNGRGALRVDNNTADDIRVYVDGAQVGTTGDFSDRVFDLEPGVYRIVLDEKGGDRSYRDDIDIIENRLTVLDVAYDDDFDDDDYDVEVFFD
jgi:hypothetical protein